LNDSDAEESALNALSGALAATSADDVATNIPRAIAFVRFLSLGCAAMERRTVRKATLHWLSLPTWASVGERRREAAFVESGGKLSKHWQAAVAKKQHLSPAAAAVPALLRAAINALATVSTDAQSRLFVASVLALLVDVESQLATRRFGWLVVDASRILPAAHVALCADEANAADASLDLLRRHLTALQQCHAAPIDAFRGAEFTADEVDARHSANVARLQRAAFARLQSLPTAMSSDVTVKDTLTDIALGNVSRIDQRKSLTALLELLDDESLTVLARDALQLDDNDGADDTRAVLTEALVERHERPVDANIAASALSLFPDERQLFDTGYLPEYDDDAVDLASAPLALPKLGLQFLSMRDYLLRSFELYRLASIYDVRLDLEEAISLSAPRPADNGMGTVFGGVARMALPVGGCAIDKIEKPRVGERKPSKVVGSLAITLAGLPAEWAAEWDAIERHDALFLVTLSVRHDSASEAVASLPFAERFGVVAVRGCTLQQFADGNGKSLLDKNNNDGARANGNARQLTVLIDTAQYGADSEQGATFVDRVYSRINLVVRRKRDENTFKSGLEAIRDLMQQHDAVPEWLSDALLGYGDPSAAASGHYNIDADVDNATVVDTIDTFDTFLDAAHLREAFGERAVVFDSAATAASVAATVPDEQPAKKSKKASAAAAAAAAANSDVTCAPPYRLLVPRNTSEPVRASTYEPTLSLGMGLRNAVRFTARQSDAILRGMLPGLTLVVGPPGTGKTDCAAQIVSNLYHAHPYERILIVTHSNAALNHLFDKLVLRDVDHRHMLRLGHGAEQLAANEDFSRFGRVTHMLARRLALLGAASELAHSLPTAPLGENDVDSCQLAEHLFVQHVRPLFEAWLSLGGRTEYPFAAWERERRRLPPGAPLLPGDGGSDGTSDEARLEAARTLFTGVSAIFDELRDCRAFEIMRSATHRSDYLTTHQARIVAMTTTHAAIKRSQLAELGFGFDTVVMEEAAQVLEIDTFVSFMLQQRAARLKRITLIGDHRQLPPVVASAALRKHSHFDQSMFARLVRLGVPTTVLDAQGRARPSLARLFDWRYDGLRTLPALEQAAAVAGSPYALANAGLSHVMQFIDVPDYEGHGETAPVAHFFQNLGEAEYVVALYQYLRLLGHPAQSITLLTTYNGQKQLLNDVVNARCGKLGRPAKISTVDKYQGQQNDIVLLSLVRTKSVGHLRDVRRLIVALSRARLGLYVFGRASLFGECAELKPALSQLLSKPTKLELVRNERFGAVTRAANDERVDLQIDGVVQLSQLLN
jgi:intron-binding protein aquarius